MDNTPSYLALYIQDNREEGNTNRVLCGSCLDDEFECWPEDWSEITVHVRRDYQCEKCGQL